MAEPAARTLLVEPGAPRRLEGLVRSALPGCSRRVVQRLIAEGMVRLNGRRAPKGAPVQPGDLVTLPADAALAPEPDLPVAVAYADDDVLVLEKPGGMPAHALDPWQHGTVAAWLLAHHPETAALGDPLAPGLVHRLDTGTSGLLLVARHARAWSTLRTAFRARAVLKTYLAVVTGTLASPLHVDTPLAHDPQDPGRMVPARPGLRAWPASTDIAPVVTCPHGTLVRATMRTGVTHQIRAHLALAAHPILNDRRYGGPTVPSLPPGRHALHAASLRFPHPTTARDVDVSSPLPADLASLPEP